MSNKKNYLDHAFLSAYTNIPISQKGDVFINEIKDIFSRYTERLKEFTNIGNKKKSGKTPEGILYQPVPYCLFGDFDLAIFSLIDDFSFASRKFKPNLEGANFKYQINTGIVPLIDIYKQEKSRLEVFKTKELVGFFDRTRFYPFTGITSLKLNNSMLVGVGQDFIDMMSFYLVLEIDAFIREQEKKELGFSMFFIITDNLGWNELTVYFFSNSLEGINEISQRIKSNRLRDIRQVIDDASTAMDKNNTEAKEKLLCIDQLIGEQSLLSDMISKEKQNDVTSQVDYLESHPVVACATLFGYHINHILKDGLRKDLKKLTAEQKKLYKKQLRPKVVSMSWNVKPGHEKNAGEALLSSMPQRLARPLRKKTGLHCLTQAGKFAYQFPDKPISLRDYFALLISTDQRFQGEMLHNIIKYKSRIQFVNHVTPKPYDTNKHYEYDLNCYKINPEACKNIVARLRTYPISQTIKSQVENLILNFNDAVTDPLMYNYFIGLRNPLLKFLDSELLYDTSTKDIQPGNVENAEVADLPERYLEPSNMFPSEEEIVLEEKRLEIVSSMKAFTSFVETWNKAYWNRHFHGYYFTEINDFNIEHHGGIQQILFCYDVIYKIISKRIYGEASTDPFVNVRIDPVITSSKYFNTINFMHLFKPSVYACECVHEAANEVIPHIVKTLKKIEYAFLSNPQNIYEKSFDEQTASFEAGLKETIGSRDAFEVQFINEYVGINSIRYIFTDYISCALAYKVKKTSASGIDMAGLKLFYHTRWFLFLTRADLYVTDTDKGSWYFNETDFKFLFIRCNLMFTLMYGLKEEDLAELNKDCPSVELKPYWNSMRDSLINFVVRLAGALETEFDNRNVSISEVEALIRKEIIERKIDEDERVIYDKVINLNYDLIHTFYEHFRSGERDNYYNTIIRNATNTRVYSNIDFYDNHNREIFLDPKGNIFSISEERRVEILQINICFLKNIWDIAMKASKRILYDES